MMTAPSMVQETTKGQAICPYCGVRAPGRGPKPHEVAVPGALGRAPRAEGHEGHVGPTRHGWRSRCAGGARRRVRTRTDPRAGQAPGPNGELQTVYLTVFF